MADNTQDTGGSSKKKKVAAAAVAAVLALVLTIGGTLSYLQDTTDAVKNDFNPNGNSVSISEDGAADDDNDGIYTQDFEIVPGTTDEKDPEVTAVFTIDSYVFLLVDDDTQGLVDYELNVAEYDEDGNVTSSGIWTLLYSEDDSPIEGYAVYYKLVTTEDTTDSSSGITVSSAVNEETDVTIYTEVLNVITGGTVSYSAALTNESMTDEDGNLLSGITLSFQALIIQAEPFSDAAEALSGYLGLIGKATTGYTAGEEATLKVSVNTAIASSSGAESSSTTFTATVPSDTELSSTDSDGNTVSITKLQLIVEEISAYSSSIANDSTYSVGEYTYDISLVDQNGNTVSASSGLIQVDIQIATGLTNVSVSHNDTAMTAITDTSSITSAGYYYNSITGVLSIYTSSFSNYTVSWDDSESISIVDTAAELTAAFTSSSDSSSESGETTVVIVTDDITTTTTIDISSNAAIYLEDDAVLTNTSDNTIKVEDDAEVTITGGTIDATAHAKAAIVNNGGTVSISGTTITRSKEAGTSSSDNGGNSYYAIENYGTITLNDCTVEADGKYSSLILNSTDDDASAVAYLTITGGTYTGGLNTIKNSAGAILTINSGTFTNTAQNVILNSGMATINGGTFTISGVSGAVFYNWYYGTNASSYGLYNDWYSATGSTVLMPAILKITGGTFTSESSYAIWSLYGSDWANTDISVSGGTFDDKYVIYPTSASYLADGYTLQANDDGTYSVVSSSEDE